MTPLLSSHVSDLGDDISSDIRLLPDEELMSIWEQTQLAVAAIEARGGYAANARKYENAVVLEMQRRIDSMSFGGIFGEGAGSEPSGPIGTPGVVVIRV